FFVHVDEHSVPFDERTKATYALLYRHILIHSDRRISLKFFTDKFTGAFKGYIQWILSLWQRNESFSKSDIRTKTTVVDLDFFSFISPQNFREKEKIQRLLERDAGDILIWAKARELLVLVLGVSNLRHRPEFTQTHAHGLARFRIGTQYALAAFTLGICLHFLYIRMEVIVKVPHHLGPVDISFGDFVKVLFNFSRKMIIEDA